MLTANGAQDQKEAQLLRPSAVGRAGWTAAFYIDMGSDSRPLCSLLAGGIPTREERLAFPLAPHEPTSEEIKAERARKRKKREEKAAASSQESAAAAGEKGADSGGVAEPQQPSPRHGNRNHHSLWVRRRAGPPKDADAPAAGCPRQPR